MTRQTLRSGELTGASAHREWALAERRQTDVVLASFFADRAGERMSSARIDYPALSPENPENPENPRSPE